MTESFTTKDSRPDEVDEYMRQLVHPLKDVVEALRQTILAADPSVGEEVKWNAPAFFYTGEMPPFDAKEFRRHLVVTNLHRQNEILLVFWGGGKVSDPSGLLEGNYEDGRRIATFRSLDEVESKKTVLQEVVREQLGLLQK
ncbi:MAG: DUF1801 domain-containing protein [Coriobacteriales bacterium]|nr:DUF1801 domain-containing protein [Coriobacteriales bacterium]